jgi:hypothetical protein
MHPNPHRNFSTDNMVGEAQDLRALQPGSDAAVQDRVGRIIGQGSLSFGRAEPPLYSRPS